MTVLAEDEYDEVVEEKLESVASRPLVPPTLRAVIVLDDSLPVRTPELIKLSTSLALNIFPEVLSLPLLSLPLSFSLPFPFALSRPPARTNPSGLKLPIGLLPTDEHGEGEGVVRVHDLPRDCG